jgi:hypothetical protein
MNPALVAALRGMYASRGAEAAAILEPWLAAEFRFVPGGTSAGALQKDYLGPAGFLEFIEAQAAWTGDSWWPRLDELLVGERWIVGVVFVTAVRARDGRQEEFEIIHRWEVDGDLIVTFHSFNNDQRRYDDFHSGS